jgi:hypothetical protein
MCSIQVLMSGFYLKLYFVQRKMQQVQVQVFRSRLPLMLRLAVRGVFRTKRNSDHISLQSVTAVSLNEKRNGNSVAVQIVIFSFWPGPSSSPGPSLQAS